MPRIRYFASDITWGRILIASQMVSNPDHKFHLASNFIRPLLVPLSLVAQLVKNKPAMQETSTGFIGQEDPMEKG